MCHSSLFFLLCRGVGLNAESLNKGLSIYITAQSCGDAASLATARSAVSPAVSLFWSPHAVLSRNTCRSYCGWEDPSSSWKGQLWNGAMVDEWHLGHTWSANADADGLVILPRGIVTRCLSGKLAVETRTHRTWIANTGRKMKAWREQGPEPWRRERAGRARQERVDMGGRHGRQEFG